MEALTIYPKNKEQLNALEIILKAMKIPFEKEAQESTYDPEFVAKIQKSRESYRAGKGSPISVRELNELWK